MKSIRIKVFLNHASEDKPLVRKLYQSLKSEPWLDPWLDEERILPGQDWQSEIDKALKDSDAVIICLSRISVAKVGVVQAEIRKARELQELRPEDRIFMIPVLLEDCEVPNSLRKYHWANISKTDNLRQVIASLELLRSRKAESPAPAGIADNQSFRKTDLPLQAINRVDLRKLMAQKYDLESLRVLCFDLDIPYQDLPSGGVSAKIVDLIEYAKRHNKYELLLRAVLNAEA